MRTELSLKAGRWILLLAFVILVLLIFGLLDTNKQNILAYPGNILLSSFQLVAFFIPLHILLLIFLYKKEQHWQSIGIWSLFVLPFVFLVLMFQCLTWAELGRSMFIDALVTTLGQVASATFFFLAAIIAVLFLMVAYVRIVQRKAPVDSRSIAADLPTLSQYPTKIMTNNFENTFVSSHSAQAIANSELLSELPPVQRTVPLVEGAAELPSVNLVEYYAPEHREAVEDHPFVEYELEEIPDTDITNTQEPPVSSDSHYPDAPRDADTMRISNTQQTDANTYNIPVNDIFIVDKPYKEQDEHDIHRLQALLRETLAEFDIEVQVTGISKGSSITRLEVLPSPGIKLTRITSLVDNIALSLAAESIRIISPIPGKHAVGIEIPNKKRRVVRFGTIVRSDEFTKSGYSIPIVLGEGISGEKSIIDLTHTPHILIAGATGSGKSVCVNTIICSILTHCSPDTVKLLLIDPKIVELKIYNDIPHLLTPVITQSSRVFQALQYCIYEMEHRYNLLETMSARNIQSYNQRVSADGGETIPYIVVIIDEFADLMASTGKELESIVARLAAMSRAVGIHLVLATQRPSIDVLTGLIKANIPSRIAFMVASKVDSRIILDSMGAEKLLGKGDMLFSSALQPVPSRIQGAYISEEELEMLTEYVRSTGPTCYIDDEIFMEDNDTMSMMTSNDDDPVYQDALGIVQTSRKASASYLQRRLKIGYNRAARLIEIMEEKGIVGPQNGSKAREVLIT